MGSIKDIYDIIADLATRATSKQHKEEIAHLNSRVKQLERDHVTEIAKLKEHHAAEIASMNATGPRAGSWGSNPPIQGLR
jgi:hypothetical protein